MDASEHNELPAGQVGPRFEPYVRLLRSLLPRVSSVALFGPEGELKWTTDTMLGPDLTSAVDEALVAGVRDLARDCVPVAAAEVVNPSLGRLA